MNDHVRGHPPDGRHEKTEYPWWRKPFHNGAIINTVLVITFATWLGFQIGSYHPPIMDQALMTVLGIWVTNKTYEQRKRDDKVDVKIEQTAVEVGKLKEQINVTTTTSEHDEVS
ncbi:MAG: hypothetical protein JOY78_00255 [Pseudonocardia sp.]|nr:hypothetical protein [Pseudonocardia sp.]